MTTTQYIKKSLLLAICLSVLFSNINLAQTIVSKADVRKYNLGLGKVTFLNKCTKCHKNIDSEAPKLDSINDWKTRISTSVDNLIQHAINGHGKMPPKGEFETLTNREVSAAVAYAVDQSRRLIINSGGKIMLNQKEICIESNHQNSCNSTQIDNSMLLNLMWLMTNKNQYISK